MQTRTLKTVEYDKIIEQLVLRANSCISREICAALVPSTDYSEAMLSLELTMQAETIYRRSGYSPVDDFPDMRGVLQRIHAIAYLSPAELLNIASCLRISREARDTLIKDEELTLLINLAHTLITYEYIEDEVHRCIMNEDEVSDSASPALARIRKQIRLANEKIREKLNAMVRSASFQKYLQEPIITIRNGRYVLPVKQEYRLNVPGLVHDQSGSGQTLFIEPAISVELGNELKRLEVEEKVEIERILSELTAIIVPYSKDIYNNLFVLGEIDAAFAKAKLAREMFAVCPKLNQNGNVKIIRGRHPLIPRDVVVPVDIWLGDGFRTLIITGPNTGGKTVTIKTVGLFSLMAMSGMFVPANEGTELCVFSDVFADIGDEQSIEQSLSTFSSHMKNIVSILEDADNNTLVLLDELGAGTDPREGAALAMSILETLHERGCTTLATTHYSEIKAFALSREGMENASMEFDVNKLCPTYRLFIGIPGKSNAFEISKRLGIHDDIIDKAKQFLNSDDVRFEDIISNADTSRKIAERERELAEQARAELDAVRREVDEERRRFEEEKEKHKRKAKDDAKRLFNETKAEMERIIKMLRELKNVDSRLVERTIQEARDAMRAVEDKLSQTDEASKAPKADSGKPPKTVSVGDVVSVVGLDSKATVLSVPDAKGDVLLQVGIMKITMKLTDLRISDEDIRHTSKSSLPKRKSVPLELDIRGKNVDESIPVVDGYLEDAAAAGLTEVSIIHGKGTGALRAGIQQYLKGHRRVKTFRMGNYGEGDAGVTVVSIKK